MANSNQLWVKILRWIAVLPTSALGMVLTFFLFRILNSIGISRFVDINSWFFILYTDIMSNALAGAAFIFIGYKVAPTNQKTVTLVLASLLLVLSGSALFIVNIMTSEYYSNLGIIFINIGSIGSCVEIFKDKKN